MSTTASAPGLLRRLAAMAYDAAALFSVLFVASAAVVIPVQAVWGIEDISGYPLFRIYLGLIVVVFFGWFWTHGGQTLGLRAWHMRLVRIDGKPVGWLDVLKRLAATLMLWLPLQVLFVLAATADPVRDALVAWTPFGIGLLWILFDRRKLAWHDRLSGTRPVMAKD